MLALVPRTPYKLLTLNNARCGSIWLTADAPTCVDGGDGGDVTALGTVVAVMAAEPSACGLVEGAKVADPTEVVETTVVALAAVAAEVAAAPAGGVEAVGCHRYSDRSGSSNNPSL